MRRTPILLTFTACLFAAAAIADTASTGNRMLVATEQIQGDVFVKTVIVLLHYDSRGAMGLVINRPTDVAAAEVMPDDGALAGFEGNLFWGGPVQMDSLRALLKTDDPPGNAQRLVGSVYLVTIDESLSGAFDGHSNLRLYLGYAGWAPGQLDRELATGSWIMVDVTEDRVFPEDPVKLWKELAPRVEHRAAVTPLRYIPGPTR